MKEGIEKSHEHYTKRLNFRLTEAEYERFEKDFKTSRFHKKSSFIRAKIFSKKISDQHEKRYKAFIEAGKLSTEINKIGANFNQLMHGINTYKVIDLKPMELQIIRHLGYKIEEMQRLFEDVEL